MQINRLYLKNFRGFSEREFTFHDRLTIIVGQNASGKSSLLEGLSVALGGWLCGFDGEGIDKRNLIKADRRTIASKVNSAMIEQIPVIVECDATFQNGENVTWSRSLTSLTGRTTTVGLKQLREITEKLNKKVYAADDIDIVLPIVAYYSAARLWNEPIHREQSIRKDKIRLDAYKRAVSFSNSITDTMNYVNRLAYVGNGKNGTDAKSKLVAIMNAIKTSLETVVHGIDVYYDMDLAEFCVQNQAGEYIQYSHLSDGYRCAASLIIDICRRIMTLNPQLGAEAINETSGVVLIDEIDLHLHPKWQQNILNDLQRIFPKIQFIVTTHAASVVQSAQDANLILLKNDGTADLSQRAYGLDVNTVLLGVMDAKVRPEAIEKKFNAIYKHKDNGELALAYEKIEQLELLVGERDPGISELRISLDLEALED